MFFADIFEEKEVAILHDFVNGVASMTGRYAVELFESGALASLRHGETLVIDDISSDAALTDADRQAFTTYQIAACIHVSLNKGGRLVGVVGVHSSSPRSWTTSEVALVQETAERTWAAVERVRDAQRIRASLAEKETTLRHIHHRVKNNLQLITSLINLQASQLKDTRSVAMLDAIRSRVYSIAAVHEITAGSQEHAGVDMAAYATQFVPELLRLHDSDQRIEASIEGSGFTLALDRAVPCALLMNELVSNACKHAFPIGQKGEVRVWIGRQEQDNVLIVEDTGVGLPAGVEYHRPVSLGFRLIHMLSRQLGGGSHLISRGGTCVQVTFPASETVGQDRP